MFCKNCGKEIDDKAAICVHCGVNIKNSQSEGKSWITTLLLCLFFGGFGVHRFYTGHTGSAVIQMLLTFTVFGIFISLPWVWIDFFIIIGGGFKSADGQELVR